MPWWAWLLLGVAIGGLVAYLALVIYISGVYR